MKIKITNKNQFDIIKNGENLDSPLINDKSVVSIV